MLKSELKKPRLLRSLASPVFSSQDVTRITGVSLRQLQWWDEQGMVTPTQHGHKRQYQIHEVVEVALIHELREKGISLQKIRRGMDFLHQKIGRNLVESTRNEHDVHLLTDGKSFHLESDSTRIMDIFNNARQPMITVCVSDQIRRVFSAALKKSALKKSVQSETRAAMPPRTKRVS